MAERTEEVPASANEAAGLVQDSGRAEQLLASANEAAGVVQRAYFIYLLVSLYLAILIGSTTHEQLLRGSGVPLPVFDVQLSIFGVYAIAPWLYVALHVNLLVQHYMLSRKLHRFSLTIQRRDDEHEWRVRLYPSLFAQMLAGAEPGSFKHFVLRTTIFMTVVAAPVILLLWMQIRFLPYHSESVTWGNRLALFVDLGMLWYYWPLMSQEDGSRPWRLLTHRNQSSAREAELKGWRRFLQPIACIATIAVFLFSTLVAVVPGGFVEWLTFKVSFHTIAQTRDDWWRQSGRADGAAQPAAGDQPGCVSGNDESQSISAGFLERHLDVREAKLLEREAPPEFLAALVNHADKTKERERMAGLVLEGRDLRGAILRGADLTKADLEGAILNGADLGCTKLIGANLSKAKLQRAALSSAKLRDAKLLAAELDDGSTLNNVDFFAAALQGSILIGVDLAKQKLTGADLRRANLKGANLGGADLRGASLMGADLRGADLRGAKLLGADLKGADLRGTSLRGAELGGAEFLDTKLAYADLREIKYYIDDDQQPGPLDDIPAVLEELAAAAKTATADRKSVLEANRERLEKAMMPIGQPDDFNPLDVYCDLSGASEVFLRDDVILGENVTCDTSKHLEADNPKSLSTEIDIDDYSSAKDAFCEISPKDKRHLVRSLRERAKSFRDDANLLSDQANTANNRDGKQKEANLADIEKTIFLKDVVRERSLDVDHDQVGRVKSPAVEARKLTRLASVLEKIRRECYKDVPEEILLRSSPGSNDET